MLQTLDFCIASLSECIIRYWDWLQGQKDTNRTNWADETTSISTGNGRGTYYSLAFRTS